MVEPVPVVHLKSLFLAPVQCAPEMSLPSPRSYGWMLPVPRRSTREIAVLECCHQPVRVTMEGRTGIQSKLPETANTAVMHVVAGVCFVCARYSLSKLLYSRDCHLLGVLTEQSSGANKRSCTMTPAQDPERVS